MESMELNSFVTKFNYLWKSGQDAYLNIDTYAGNAWVGLSLNLGPFPTGPVNIHSSPRKQDSLPDVEEGSEGLQHVKLRKMIILMWLSLKI